METPDGNTVPRSQESGAPWEAARAGGASGPTMHASYGSVEAGEGAPAPRGVRHTRVAVLLGLWALALVLAMVAVGAAGASQRRTVLDDKVDDPLAGLDETPHEWTDEHGDGYDPEKQNVWADEDAFEVPFVGYAKKDLKWRAPAEPETNVLDYLPQVRPPPVSPAAVPSALPASRVPPAGKVRAAGLRLAGVAGRLFGTQVHGAALSLGPVPRA